MYIDSLRTCTLLAIHFFFLMLLHISYSLLFFFNDTATTEIYTLSLHDALPILCAMSSCSPIPARRESTLWPLEPGAQTDRKSTRLNSSHLVISYAVFCLKKKKKNRITIQPQPNIHPD